MHIWKAFFWSWKCDLKYFWFSNIQKSIKIKFIANEKYSSNNRLVEMWFNRSLVLKKHKSLKILSWIYPNKESRCSVWNILNFANFHAFYQFLKKHVFLNFKSLLTCALSALSFVKLSKSNLVARFLSDLAPNLPISAWRALQSLIIIFWFIGSWKKSYEISAGFSPRRM